MGIRGRGSRPGKMPAANSTESNTRHKRNLRNLNELELDSIFNSAHDYRERVRPPGVLDAPTFRPTETEFRDCLSYIQTIAPEGKKFGIVKIIPPKGWRPNFAIDTSHFSFKTRKQNINSMNCVHRASINYTDQLYKFHQQNKTALPEIPHIDGKEMNMYKFKRAVDELGGYNKVCEMENWSQIANKIGLATKDPSLSTSGVKHIYEQVIMPYEAYVLKAKISANGDTSSIKVSPLKKKLMSKTVQLNGWDNRNGGSLSNGTRTASDHLIGEMTENVKIEHPISDVEILHDRKRQRIDSEPLLKKENVGNEDFSPNRTKRKYTRRKPVDPKPGDVCEICGYGTKAKSIILCDGCDRGYHIHCLNPPLEKVPEDDWYCNRCIIGTGDFGFEDGGQYSLREFHIKADNLKSSYFPSWSSEKHKHRFENEVEKVYWKMIDSGEKSVVVEYGADIKGTVHGSGFPTIEKQPLDAYSVDSWNLNYIPIEDSSLLRLIGKDISGMTVPWLYAGMCFSTFCWHNEDHYTYSINYQHFGDTKTWYGVPGEQAKLLESAIKSTVPDLFEQQPDLLYQLVSVVDLEILQKKGVKIYSLDQHANEFVITFPKSYHSGFNHGFNFNEAVNFATSDWITEGFSLESVKEYQHYHRSPVFSHDQLLCSIVEFDDSIETACWLLGAFDEMYRREIQDREKIRSTFPGLQEELLEPGEDEDVQCSFCKIFCYLSKIVDKEHNEPFCSDHINLVKSKGVILRKHYDDQALLNMLNKIQNRASIPKRWRDKFEKLLRENERPPLKALKSLLSEAERIPYQFEELDALREFVAAATEWVDEAALFLARKQSTRRKSEKGWRKAFNIHVNEEESETSRNDEKYISSMLEKVERMAFDSPELAHLRAKATELHQLKTEVLAFMDNDHLTVSEWKEILTRARSFNIDIPEIAEFELHIKQLEWVEKFNQSYGHSVSLKEIRDLLSDGAACNIPETNAYMQRLKNREEIGIKWDRNLSNMLSLEPIPVKKLMYVIEHAENISIEENTFMEMSSILSKINEATEAAEDLISRANLPDLALRPISSDVQKVLSTIQMVPCKPEILVKLSTMMNELYDWLKRAKTFFGKPTAPLEILTQHLLYVEKRCTACFSLTDRPRGPGEPVSRETTPEILDDSITGSKSSELFCICRQPEHGMMIECDICHEWYHGRCLRMTKRKLMTEERFVCPICDWRVNIPRIYNRPRLEELVGLLNDASTLPFKPSEYDLIGRIVETCRNYRHEIQGLVSSPFGLTYAEAPIIRFHLRKLEGAEILLANETYTLRSKLHHCNPVAPYPPPAMEDTYNLRGMRSVRKPRSSASESANEKGSSSYSHIRTANVSPSDSYDHGTLKKEISAYELPSEHGIMRTKDESIDGLDANQVAALEKELPIENVKYCICQQPYLSNIHFEMIHCEACHNWFHYGCVGLDAETVNTLATYTCPECSIRQNQPYAFANRMQSLINKITHTSQQSLQPVLRVAGIKDSPVINIKSRTEERKVDEAADVEDSSSQLEGGMEFLNM